MKPVVHQTWKNNKIPPEWTSYVDGWMRYPHVLWTDEDITRIMGGVDFWHRYRTPIEKVDAARYFILRDHGGVYVDLDFQLIKDIAPLLTHSFVAGLEPVEHARLHHQDRIISNAFMAVEKGCGFINHVCDRLQYFQDRENPLQTTGPIFLTQMYEEYAEKGEISILESKFLYPLVKDSSDRVSSIDLPPDAYAVHHYWGSWWR